MNQAEYLCHSSGPWKKHKYFQKIGSGASAVYRYAKKGAKNIDNAITGNGYREQATRYYSLAGTATEDVDPNSPKFNPRKKEYRDKMIEKGDQMLDKSENSLIERMNDISAKDTIAKGAKALKDFFNPPAKVTTTHTFFEGKGSTSKKTKTNPDGSKVTVTTTTYPRKKK